MTARRLADFVESTAAGEQLLLQRLRDAEHAATSGDFPGVECCTERAESAPPWPRTWWGMSSMPCSRSRTIDQMSPAFPRAIVVGQQLEPPSTYFRNLWVVHPLLSEAQSRVRRLMQLGLRDRIIVLNGPTGVGKTRLCRMVLADCMPARIVSAWRRKPSTSPRLWWS